MTFTNFYVIICIVWNNKNTSRKEVLIGMFNVGDKIVYPMHGAGTIHAIEKKSILNEEQDYYIISMPGEVKVMVPTQKAEEIGVRNIIDNALHVNITGFVTIAKSGTIFLNNIHADAIIIGI